MLFVSNLISGSSKDEELKPGSDDITSIKIAKKSGDILGIYPVGNTTTFGDLVAFVQPQIPTNYLETHRIAFYNKNDSTNAIEFPLSYKVQQCVASIKESTVFMLLMPKPAETGQGFL